VAARLDLADSEQEIGRHAKQRLKKPFGIGASLWHRKKPFDNGRTAFSSYRRAAGTTKKSVW
jgi:hypothetical protein